MATKKAPAKSTTAAKKAPAAKVTAEAAAPKPVAAKKAPAKKAAAPATEKATPAHAEIAKLAHKFYEERGGHHGSHEHDWHRAEQHLRKA